MSTSATRCPDCNEPTPTGGWVDQSGRTHHVGCGDPLGTKALVARIAELESALYQIIDRAEYRMSAKATDDVVGIARNALAGGTPQPPVPVQAR